MRTTVGHAYQRTHVRTYVWYALFKHDDSCITYSIRQNVIGTRCGTVVPRFLPFAWELTYWHLHFCEDTTRKGADVSDSLSRRFTPNKISTSFDEWRILQRLNDELCIDSATNFKLQARRRSTMYLLKYWSAGGNSQTGESSTFTHVTDTDSQLSSSKFYLGWVYNHL